MYIKDKKNNRITRLLISWSKVAEDGCEGRATIDVWKRGDSLLGLPRQSGSCIVYVGVNYNGKKKDGNNDILPMTIREEEVLMCMAKSFFTGVRCADIIDEQKIHEVFEWVGLKNE